MKTSHSSANLQFHLECVAIDVQNIIFEPLIRPIPAHSHGNHCYEIHYVSEGCGRLKADGQDFDVVPGSLYVTGPHVEHSQFSLPQDPMKEYCLYLKLEHGAANPASSPVLSAFAATRFWFGQDETQLLSPIISRIFEELRRQDTGWRIQAEALLSQLIVILVRNYEGRKDGFVKPDPDFGGDKKSLLIEEYFLYEYPTLSLEGLAERLGLSARQTQRLLKEYYGKTFRQKKAEAKMSAAAILLEDRERSITAIASLLGYSSAEHFSSAFHAYYRQTPREYRKSLPQTENQEKISQRKVHPQNKTPQKVKRS